MTTSPSIWHEIRIKSSPDVVHQALTDPKKLGQWFTEARGESVVGKTLEFRFYEFWQPMQVAASEAAKLVRWRAAPEGLPDWRGTEVEFTLFAKNGRTYVQLRHSGWRETNSDFPFVSMSWAAFLISLKELVEKDRGYPFPNPWLHD